MIDGFEQKWPDWFTPSRQAPKQARAVMQGRHPMGLRLAGNGETCGTCAFRKDKRFARGYQKCTKTRQSASQATDIRLKWPACELWEKTT